MVRGAGRIIGRYQGPGLRARGYLHARWLVCPFDRLLPFLPDEGALLDVGCGSGLWLTYLAQERPRLELHGVDPDARKLALATKSAALERVELRQGSIGDAPERTFDVVTILDVLYLVPGEVKHAMLRASWRALRPGGTIVLKDTDTAPWWKYAPAALEEVVAVHVLGMTVGRLHFASAAALAAALAAAGFADVETRRIDGGYLHPHVVLRARKPT
jgi:2-polyprenyl-3-methyl-5-hydroxy-6-metoxy-1,4-benzoquinol methylase